MYPDTIIVNANDLVSRSCGSANQLLERASLAGMKYPYTLQAERAFAANHHASDTACVKIR